MVRRGKGKLEQEKTKIKLRSRVLDGFVGEEGGPESLQLGSPTPCRGGRMAETTALSPSSGEQPGLLEALGP